MVKKKGTETENQVGPNSRTSEYMFKILVIGNLSTGKTSIIKRYVHQFFSDHYRATVGVDFALKVLSWDADTIIRLQLWDIAGQERYAGGMTRVYYKEAVGAFVVFDMTDTHSLDSALRWKKDLDEKVTLPNGNPIPSVLLGNKCDKSNEYIPSTGKMEDLCKEAGFNTWFQTSAKENINIEEAAKFLISRILKLERDGNISNESFDSDRISVSIRTNNKIADVKRGCLC